MPNKTVFHWFERFKQESMMALKTNAKQSSEIHCTIFRILTKRKMAISCIWRRYGKLILDDIQTALETVDQKVFYGMVDESQITSSWNYTVFLRKRLSIGNNKQEYSDRFTVAIVRENYIPVDLPEQIINAMCGIDGMRISSSDCEYSYVQKPNTNTVVELLTIEFVRARKRVVS